MYRRSRPDKALLARRLFLGWWLIFCSSSLAGTGCSFLLDFEELKQTEAEPESQEPEVLDDTSADDDGRDDDVGEGGDDDANADDANDDDSAIPDDDASPEPDVTGTACQKDGDCDDENPCTTDSCASGKCSNAAMVCSSSDPCTKAYCDQGDCVEEHITGIVADGFARVLTGVDIHRAQLIAGINRFYSAAYGDFGDGNDVRLSSFDATGSGTSKTYSLATGFSADWELVSPAALAASTEADLEINVYVAIRRAGEPDALGNMVRVRFDGELNLVTEDVPFLSSRASYTPLSETLGPSAGFDATDGLGLYIAWPGENQDGSRGVFVHSGQDSYVEALPGSAFIAVEDPVVSLAALQANGEPGAVWVAAPALGGSHVQIATTRSPAPLTLGKCEASTDLRGRAIHANRTFENLWMISWSQQSPAEFVTENTFLSCSEGTCVDQLGRPEDGSCTTEEYDSRVNLGVGSLVVEAFQRPGEEDRLYQTALLAGEIGIALQVNRVDNLSGDTSSTRLDTVSLAESSETASPDWPALALLPPDKIGVSWIQRSEDDQQDELHLERHRICYPEED